MSHEHYERLWNPQAEPETSNVQAFLDSYRGALELAGPGELARRLVVADPDGLPRDERGRVILPEDETACPEAGTTAYNRYNKQEWSGPHDVPTVEQQQEFEAQGFELDSKGRPLHPLWKKLLKIGVLLGSGWGHRWGPLGAVDVVTALRQQSDPEQADDPAGLLYFAMLIRTDTGQLAFPGGHIDPGEAARTAALREQFEELGLAVPENARLVQFFGGPIADLRSTLHCWHVTTAFLTRLPDGPLPPLVPQEGEAEAAHWVALNDPRLEVLFGGHSLLRERVFAELVHEGVLTIEGLCKAAAERRGMRAHE